MSNRPLVQGPGPPEIRDYLNRVGDRGALYTHPDKVHGTIRQYNAIIRATARRLGTDFVDIWQAVVDRAGGSDGDAALLTTGIDRAGPLFDGVHLGPEGARFYAETILNAMPFRGLPAFRGLPK